jgi:hypothetical protein
MNLDQKPLKIECYSIYNDDEKTDIIFQESTQIHKHQVEKGYQILSKNDFGKVKKRINLGIFNKKTNFIVGEKSSLIVWDNKEKAIVSPDVSEMLAEKNRYFLIYDLGYIGDSQNQEITIKNKNTSEEITLILNKNFGNDIGKFLGVFKSGETEIPEKFSILSSIIKIENDKLSINKQVLINSNPEFLLGILEGYLESSRTFILRQNINIYNFTYILNLLGAQYSIRTTEDGNKHIRFKLPIFLKSITNLNENFYRKYKYIFEDGVAVLKKDIESILPENENPDFFRLVNTGIIELIPIKDLVFIELEGPQIMYDLTMSNANATNYSLPTLPYCKNSDGDVLGVVAIHTKDAAEECVRKFSTELKENFLNLSTGDVNNWGVKLDSQLGLYAATK